MMLPQRNRSSGLQLRRFSLASARALCGVALLLASCVSETPIARHTGTAQRTDYRGLAAQVDSARIAQTIHYLAGLGTRVIGYAGGDTAASFIADQFRQAGLQEVHFEEFVGASPVDEGASIRLLSTGEEFPVHCFWPNLVRTPSLPKQGIDGQLQYVGRGEFSDFNGKVIDGNFVLMDFNSGTNWLNAAELGARAVFFIEPDWTTRVQSEEKFLQSPADVPRFYVPKETASRLMAMLDRGEEVRLRAKARMVWHRTNSKNVVGIIPGVDPDLKDEVIVLGSHYDSASVVPAIAPGANQAAGLVGLLEIARVMAKHPPARTVYFLATTGHAMACAGINGFIQQHIRKHPTMAAKLPDPLNMKLYIGLDLSAQRNQMGVSFTGWLYTGDAFDKQRFFAPFGKSFTRYAAGATQALGYAPDMFINAITPIGGIKWDSWFPGKWGADGELVFWAGFPSIYLATVFDPRNLADTPLDRPEFMNISNVVQQTRLVACMLVDAVNDPYLVPDFKMDLPDGLGTLRIQAVEFDPKKSYVPDVPLPRAVFVSRRNEKTLMGVRNEYYQVGDENGWAEFSQLQIPRRTPTEAYVLDDDTGEIVYAPDYGPYGEGLYPIIVTQDWVEKEKKIVLFRCQAVDLFDLVDPRYLTRMKEATVLNTTDSEPIKYGHALLDHGWFEWMSYVESCGPVFIEPGERFKLLMGTSLLGQRLVLLNATPDSPTGTGYPATGETLTAMPYRVARDMWILDDSRLQLLRRAGIVNQRLEEMHAHAADLLTKAEEARDRLDWESFIRYSRAAWGYESRAYPDATGTANDLMKGVIFYMFLILPFSHFAERLLFGFVDIRKRIVAVTGIFLGSFVVLVLVHPAFKIASTPYIVLLAFITFALAIIVTWLIASRFGQEMGRLRRELSTVYQTDVSRTRVLAAAFALGVSNMRNRRLRVVLTCVTLILLMFTVISFTSVRTFLRFYKLDRPNIPMYDGMLIRNNSWWPIEESAYRYIQSEFNKQATVVPRAWYANQPAGEWANIFIKLEQAGEAGPDSTAATAFETIFSGLQSSNPDSAFAAQKKLAQQSFQTYAKAILGLTPQEPLVSGVDRMLIAGEWFKPGERDVCILSSAMAALLNVKPADVGKKTILLYGQPILVKGIIDDERFFRFRDLDNEPLTPVDYKAESAELTSQVRNSSRQVESDSEILSFKHMQPENVLIMPYEYVRNMDNGNIMSVAITFSNTPDLMRAIEEFMPRLGLTVFVGAAGRATVYSALELTSLSGLSNLFIPVLVAALIVLNTMMGAVYERFKEIGIFSSVGLAPTHIAVLFMAESCVYAIIGGMAGYLIGQTFSQVMTHYHLLSGLTLNYSSTSAVTSTMIVMGVVLLSTVYPARKAGQMAVPDVERAWRFPEPRGDVWQFDFPFTVAGVEVLGLCQFLRDYFSSFSEESIGLFHTEMVQLSRFDSLHGEGYLIQLRAWLAPYDMGISEDVEFRAVPLGEFNTYQIDLAITRLSGDVDSWQRVNRRFLNTVRKQFLIWRTIDEATKRRYTAQGREAIGVRVYERV